MGCRGGSRSAAGPPRGRRAMLEVLLGRQLPAGLVLTPATTDPAVARAWLAQHTAAGIEGVVAKRLDQRYRTGGQGWIKVRTRTTTEAIVGGDLGEQLRQRHDQPLHVATGAGSGGQHAHLDEPPRGAAQPPRPRPATGSAGPPRGCGRRWKASAAPPAAGGRPGSVTAPTALSMSSVAWMTASAAPPRPPATTLVACSSAATAWPTAPARSALPTWDRSPGAGGT
jgi:hypothetical protein